MIKMALRLGIGTWQNFSPDANLVDLSDMIDLAYANDIFYFDTADSYFDGAAEIILGQILKRFPRNTYKISTKCFYPTSQNPTGGLSSSRVRSSLRQSLHNLKLDYVDTYFAHRYDVNVSVEEIAITFNELIAEGTILSWGISKWPSEKIIDLFTYCKKNKLVEPVGQQFQYNLFNQDAETMSFPFYKSLGLPTIVYSPLAQGVLTGKYTHRVESDSRASSSIANQTMWDFSKDKIEKIYRWEKAIKKIGLNTSQVALAYCLRRTEVSTVLVGTRNVHQLSDLLEVAHLTWSDSLIQEFV